MSSQQESSTMGSQRGLYTSGARCRTSFLRFHESPACEYSPSLSLFSVESSPYGSQGPVTPTPRPLTGEARTPLSSSTTPLGSDSLPLPPGNQDHAWNLLHPLAVTLSTSDTVTFEIFGNYYLYTEEYHESWMEWWQRTPGYIAYTAKYAGKKKIRWNSDLRGTEVWKYFQQYADRSASAMGTPRVMCFMCRKVLAHPTGTVTSSMHNHNRSCACLKSRKINGYDGRAGSRLGIEVLKLLQKGTKTGNRRRIIDLATPAGFNQHDFEENFLKALLATNLAFNCSNNLAFHRLFKYIRPVVEIPSPTTLTRHLKRRESLRWMIFEHVYLLQERFLPLPIHGLHRTNLLFQQLRLMGSQIAGRWRTSAKTDPASDPSALRPDASDASPASHASCAS